MNFVRHATTSLRTSRAFVLTVVLLAVAGTVTRAGAAGSNVCEPHLL